MSRIDRLLQGELDIAWSWNSAALIAFAERAVARLEREAIVKRICCSLDPDES